MEVACNLTEWCQDYTYNWGSSWFEFWICKEEDLLYNLVSNLSPKTLQTCKVEKLIGVTTYFIIMNWKTNGQRDGEESCSKEDLEDNSNFRFFQNWSDCSLCLKCSFISCHQLFLCYFWSILDKYDVIITPISGGVSVVVNVSFPGDISWSVGVDFLASSKTEQHNWIHLRDFCNLSHSIM